MSLGKDELLSFLGERGEVEYISGREHGFTVELSGYPGRIYFHLLEARRTDEYNYDFLGKFDEIPDVTENTIVVPAVYLPWAEAFGTVHIGTQQPREYPENVGRINIARSSIERLNDNPWVINTSTGRERQSVSVLLTEKYDFEINLRTSIKMRASYSILDQILKDEWDESPTRAHQLSHVFVRFIDSAGEYEGIEDRRRSVQADVSDIFNVDRSTIRQKCSSPAWNQEADNYQKEFLEPVLDVVEQRWDRQLITRIVWDHLPTPQLDELFADLPPGSDDQGYHDDPSVWVDHDEMTPPPEVDTDDPPATLETDLYFPDALQGEQPLTAQIDAALRSGDHLILTGPPGSGKTQLAKRICEEYANDHTVSTATSDWTTFDTVGGYRPKRDDDGLRFVEGLFLSCFDTDDNGNATNEWLVVDELNRADVDQAFGSLFTVLTGETVELPFVMQTDDGEKRIKLVGDPEDEASTEPHYYRVPSDWRLVATMNAADKASLYRMSYAFVRRFSFVTVPVPTKNLVEPDLVGEYLDSWIDTSRYDFSDVEVEGHSTPREKLCADLATVWESGLGQGASFGPGVIEDFLEHALAELQTTGSLGYDQALAAHLLPQFEGRKDGEVRGLLNLIQDDSAVREIGEPSDAPIARQFAENHLGIDGIAADEIDG